MRDLTLLNFTKNTNILFASILEYHGRPQVAPTHLNGISEILSVFVITKEDRQMLEKPHFPVGATRGNKQKLKNVRKSHIVAKGRPYPAAAKAYRDKIRGE
jgi:hypothetical protein